MILGIDVAKNKLDIYSLPDGKHEQIKNSLPSIKRYLKEKRKDFDIQRVAFEATGGHEKLLEVCLIEANIMYERAHPKRVYHFGQGQGYFAKTDRIDAHLLAKYAQVKEPQILHHEGKKSIELKELSSRKQQIKTQLADEKRRLSQPYLNKKVIRCIKRAIRFYERELDIIANELEGLISEDEQLSKKQKLLQTIQGVGKEVSTLLVTDLPELGKLSREAISCLIGVAPRTQDSGKKQGYRSISQGRFEVRRLLYMAALVASQHNPRMKAIYTKLLAKGKKKKVALVAIMRKMIIMMNAMIKNETSWQAERI